ncbi:MAG: MBL fold metallo-hydrolase [Nanoarchaeota archaeon]
MKIEWIGTGSGLNPKLGNTSFMVSGTEKRNLLVDVGYTVPFKLMESDRLKDVSDIVITHTHADHIGGIEAVAFMNYFCYKLRGKYRINLYLASNEFAHNLWEHSLSGGLGKLQSENNKPFNATLDDYFEVKIGKEIEIPGIPKLFLFPTLHVLGMENYGLRFDNGVFYSGDSVELPSYDSRIIFQDCQFFETNSDVHMPYDKLKRELPKEVKEKTYLVHLGNGWDKKDVKKDGFAGFVMPGQIFEF